MVGKLLKTYISMRGQAKRALLARSTLIVIAQYHRSDSRAKYLYLNPTIWAIGGLNNVRRGMLEVPLPHAEDPEPLRSLARGADRRLQDWVEDACSRLEGRDSDTLRRLIAAVPTLEQEILQTRRKAVV